MNISTDVRHITPDLNKSFGGYEWWYFDGLSKDGQQGFVVIFYQTNPFSTYYIQNLNAQKVDKASYPAISVSIYEGGETVYYSFLEFGSDAFDWDDEKKTLTVDSNTVHYSFSEDVMRFELKLDQKLPSGHELSGIIKGEASGTDAGLIVSVSDERHSWNLISPQIHFEAELELTGKYGEEELKYEGSGYHDHNTGQEPMKNSFRDWYWGRYHFRDFTLVYYLMQKHNSKQFEAWLIDKENQQILEHFDKADLSYFTRNWFGLRSARKIELNSGQVSVNIQCSTKVDEGPFYQRFIGESIVNYNGQVHAAHGISEYIYPKNIYKKKFWPLVHMRLNYTEQDSHWVQKSRLMYPWTW